MTTGQRFAQRTTPFTGGIFGTDDNGIYQTNNYFEIGPVFGGGHDIFVDSALSSGYSYLYSYTDDDAPSQGKSIIEGGEPTGEAISIAGIDVFTIGRGVAATVPAPGSLALAGLAPAGVAAVRRRRFAPAVILNPNSHH